jgi:hypothetical protein
VSCRQLGKIEIGANEACLPPRFLETGAHLPDHCRTELVDVEALAPSAAQPRFLKLFLITSQHRHGSKRSAGDQIVEPRSTRITGIRLIGNPHSGHIRAHDAAAKVGFRPVLCLAADAVGVHHIAWRNGIAGRGQPPCRDRPRPPHGVDEVCPRRRRRGAAVEALQERHGMLRRQAREQSSPARHAPADRDPDRPLEFEGWRANAA